jgi:hypothetical protein
MEPTVSGRLITSVRSSKIDEKGDDADGDAAGDLPVVGWAWATAARWQTQRKRSPSMAAMVLVDAVKAA